MVTPGFQTWTIIFLLAAFQAIVIGILFASTKRGNIKANRTLAILLALFGVTLVHYVSFWTGYVKLYPHFMALSNSFPFLYGPLLLIYFRQLYSETYMSKDWLHFIPFSMHLLWLTPFYILSGSEKLEIMQDMSGKQSVIIPWIQIIHMFFYAWLASKVNNKSRNFTIWKRTLLIAFIGFVSSFMAYYLLIMHPSFSLTWDYMISGSMTIFIFVIALMGFIQPDIFDGRTMGEMIAPSKYAHSSLTPQVANALILRLDHVVLEDEVFRDPELSLHHLAEKMNISKHQLSQLINEYKQQSFSDYINSIRVQFILERFQHRDSSQTPAIQLAYEAGFNNKVSFYQHFKKHTGKTPGQYRKTVYDYRN